MAAFGPGVIMPVDNWATAVQPVREILYIEVQKKNEYGAVKQVK